MPVCPIDETPCEDADCHDARCIAWDDEDDVFDGYDDELEDPFEDAVASCAWTGRKGDVCLNAGSEHCDWDCPFGGDYRRSIGLR